MGKEGALEPLDVNTGTRAVTRREDQALDVEVKAPAPTVRRRSRLWLVPQLILPIVILFGANMVMRDMIASKPEVKQRKPRERVYVVQTAAVETKDRQPSFSVFGNVVAANSVDLRVLVAGEILKVHPSLKVGAFVEKGAPLVEIDKFHYTGAVTEANANLAEAKARLAESNARKAQEMSALERAVEQQAIAQKDLERAESLLAKGNITERSIDDRRLIVSQRQQAVDQRRNNLLIENARIEQFKTAIKRLEWRLEQAKRNLENTVLKAPFSGIVMSENVEPGRLLNANDMAIRLYDWKSLEVKFTLSDQQFGRISSGAEKLVGRKVNVIWSIGDKPISYTATIERAGAQIASQRGGIDVFARMDMSADAVKLRPGAFVRVTVPDRLIAQSIRLPETAVYSDDHVFVIDKGRLARRDVDVLAYIEGDVVVRGALKDGEQVLTTRIAEAGDGLAVRREGAPERRRGAGRPDRKAEPGDRRIRGPEVRGPAGDGGATPKHRRGAATSGAPAKGPSGDVKSGGPRKPKSEADGKRGA